MGQRRVDRRGDPEKRECIRYGSCLNIKEESADEGGVQFYCEVCGWYMWFR